ncbi:MAG: hypothetical protein JEZ06_07320 [Anaerolineaceae bacterium]|nr:hypothetical protein [Anaerolineaceae bacterium]
MNLTRAHNSSSAFSLPKINISASSVFFGIILTALLSFEMFNYSTTDFALRDLLGELKFIGIHWATILSIAFCGIDFAGIARLFTPQQAEDEPKEVWYLFGAWLLAATMNAMLTWWGVSMAITNHSLQSTSVMDTGTVMKIVPIFVAIMVWLIRILIIGTLSMAGDKLLHTNKEKTSKRRSTTNAERSQRMNTTPRSVTASSRNVSRPTPTRESF